MALVFPQVKDQARYSLEVELDEVKFRFSFEWSDRADHWLMSIDDAAGTRLLSSRRIVIGYPLLNRFRDPRLPAGMLEAIDTSDAGAEAGFADLGDRVKLLYTPWREIPKKLTINVAAV